MRFEILGPMRVTDSSGSRSVAGVRQRVLLGALLARANQPVPIEQLTEIVWDGSPPARAVPTLRTYVTRLRQTLGPAIAPRIVTRDLGYEVRLEPDELDALVFGALCQDAGAAVRVGAWSKAATAASRALALWRGTPLADVPSQLLTDQWLPYLDQQRLQVLEWNVEAELNLGHHEQLIPQLRDLTTQHPLRERFHAQLMIALARSGRQAEALEAYRDARRLLVEQLGIEPGSELRTVHQYILSGENEPSLGLLGNTTRPAERSAPQAHPAVVGPHQLPAAPRHFTGRDEELGHLTALAQSSDALAGAVVISAIDGMAGIGKTALAVQWAHHVADQFPDGQLFLDLRGFDPGGTPLLPTTALQALVESFGIAPTRMPRSPEALAGLYRSLLATRRVLLVLDNARDEAQVRPLLPGSATCLTVITSRNRLAGLAVRESAAIITLGPLNPDEARLLLLRRLTGAITTEGAGSLDATAASNRIIDACGRLPLALCIIGARAATRPHVPLSTIAAELESDPDPLRRLKAAGDPLSSVATSFSWSYQLLEPTGQRLFRMLGLHPGPYISTWAAASLAALPLAYAAQLLEQIADLHLISADEHGGYRIHDLLKAYAAEQARNAESPQARTTAIRRLLDHYLATASSAAILLDPTMLPVDMPVLAPDTVVEPLATRDEAQQWFTLHYSALLSLITVAAQTGFDVHAWQLARAMRNIFNWRGRWQDWEATHHIAIAAAERLEDPRAEALTRLAWAEWEALQHNLEATEGHLRLALDCFVRLGDLQGQARALTQLAIVASNTADYEPAIASAWQAHALFTRLGERHGQAGTLANIGLYLIRQEDPDAAITILEQARSIFAEIEQPGGQAISSLNLGKAHSALRHHAQAIDHYRDAADLGQRLQNDLIHAEALAGIGDAHVALGQHTAGLDSLRQALQILTELNHPDAAVIAARLDKARATHVPSTRPSAPASSTRSGTSDHVSDRE